MAGPDRRHRRSGDLFLSQTDPSAGGQWNPTAAVAAWLVPGLGHVVLGERERGAVIGVTIGLLWLLGLLIGGVCVIDRQAHPAWFVGQAMTAPSLVSDYVFRTRLKPGYRHPGDGPGSYEPSFGRPNEQGVLYTALAGLLNLLAVLDVAYRDSNHRSMRPGGAAGGGGRQCT